MINLPCDEHFANRSLAWPDGRRTTVDGGSKPADPDGAANPIKVQDLVSRTTGFDRARGRLGIHLAFPRPARGTVLTGPLTIIDVTKPGIDKAFGIKKLRDILGIATDETVFIGDALFPGGNDYPAEEAGVVSIRVRDPDETNRVIEAIKTFPTKVPVASLGRIGNLKKIRYKPLLSMALGS